MWVNKCVALEDSGEAQVCCIWQGGFGWSIHPYTWGTNRPASECRRSMFGRGGVHPRSVFVCCCVCFVGGGGVTEAHGSCAAAVLSVTVASLAAAAAAVACTKPHTLRPQPSSSDAAVCRPDRHHSHASAVCTRLPSVQVGHHARGAGMRQLCRGCPM